MDGAQLLDARAVVVHADAGAEAVARHPDRFAGFAVLPMCSPDDAARELERSVRDLGFLGALINGTTDVCMASRPMKDAEKLKLRDRFQTMGVEIPVAKDGLSVYVNQANGAAFNPRVTNGGNYLDERVAWHLTMYPQPFGFQAEYTIGRGPELNADRTDIVLGKVSGGYMQVFYRYQCETYCQSVYPFIRVQEYFGGRKAELNAPRNSVREWEVGLEYQFNRALELTVMYTWTQRNTPDATFLPNGSPPGQCAVSGTQLGPCVQTPYQLQSGNLLRFQLQWNF